MGKMKELFIKMMNERKDESVLLRFTPDEVVIILDLLYDAHETFAEKAEDIYYNNEEKSDDLSAKSDLCFKIYERLFDIEYDNNITSIME